MPYTEIGAFMAELRGQDGIAARALELAILSAVRSGEVIGARWDEIDPDARMWTIPGARNESWPRAPRAAQRCRDADSQYDGRDLPRQQGQEACQRRFCAPEVAPH